MSLVIGVAVLLATLAAVFYLRLPRPAGTALTALVPVLWSALGQTI